MTEKGIEGYTQIISQNLDWNSQMRRENIEERSILEIGIGIIIRNIVRRSFQGRKSTITGNIKGHR
jgi:hypothetical protein